MIKLSKFGFAIDNSIAITLVTIAKSIGGKYRQYIVYSEDSLAM